MRIKAKFKSPYTSLNPNKFKSSSKLVTCLLIWLYLGENFHVECGESGQFQNQPLYSAERLANIQQQRGKEKRSYSSINGDENGYGGEVQQQQLVPTGYLFPKPFSKSGIFNQANGALAERDPSEEAETNGRLGVLDYDVPQKHVGVRSRSGHFYPNVPTTNVKRSQSLLGAREGYMCHFKLCQLGASGKRRWSPLFEFD